jgi:hypothetical protein
MKKYFIEPITGNLIIVDGNNGNTEVVPELKNVRVFGANGTAFMTQGHEENDMQSSVAPGSVAGKAPRKCGNCGEPGHQARHCENPTRR